jgi:hypothetical protein
MLSVSVSDNPQLEQVLSLWYQHETRGAAVAGDVLTQKAKELHTDP